MSNHPHHRPALLGLCAALAMPSHAQMTQLQRVEITGTTQSYRPAPTTVGTKTDTPILLTPQSVQVVPRAALNEHDGPQRPRALARRAKRQRGIATELRHQRLARLLEPVLGKRGGRFGAEEPRVREAVERLGDGERGAEQGDEREHHAQRQRQPAVQCIHSSR